MEQQSLFAQNLALQRVPSLKELAIKAYAQFLRNAAQKSFLSDVEQVAWNEKNGVDTFFNLDLGDAFQKLTAYLKNELKSTDTLCPIILSADGHYGVIYDTKSYKQHIINKNGELYRTVPYAVELNSIEKGRLPLFSPESTWFIGKRDGAVGELVCMNLRDTSQLGTSILVRIPGLVDYAFLNDFAVVIRTKDSIFTVSMEHLVVHGLSDSQKIYTRTDRLPYQESRFYRAIDFLCNTHIICFAPDKRGVEIMANSSGQKLSFKKIFMKLPSESGMLIFNRVRGMTFVQESHEGNIYGYDLLGYDPTKKNLLVEGAVSDFIIQESGDLLCCFLKKESASNIAIFSCHDITAPHCIGLIHTAPIKMFFVGSTDTQLIFRSDAGQQYGVNLEYAALLVQCYVYYRSRGNKNLSLMPAPESEQSCPLAALSLKNERETDLS
jgi:hypothetical protein